MTYMLDTNICIYAMKNNPVVMRQIRQKMGRGICISAVVLAELEHGIEKSVFPGKSRAALVQFLISLDILPFYQSAAEEYGRVRAYLEKKGIPIGPLDMLIAGHARAENLILVTNNIREFARVPDLKLENWAE